ncbi:MAG: HlyD family efflux transporter periplasmic adaptor subunit [Proteobacteria bacterium]|nr:HlyD family efflux transporter periplasmic adaptor subunit [Pseudomonadota bacterium]
MVRPAKISPISSQISSNQAKIVWLVKEGTQVTKGLLVARFDTKHFTDSLQKAEQAYADAQATYVASQKLLSLQKEEEGGKVEEVTRKVTIAQIQADNIRNGSGPLKRKTLQQQVHQAERILEISRDDVRDMNVLLEKGHVSTRERDKAADKLATATEQVAVASAELENFNVYAWPQMLREAELLVSGAESNLERTKRTGEILVQNRVAEMEKNRRDVENKKVALENARTELANCDVYSPADGVLLYPELPRENGRRKIHIGDSVWVGQTFMEVPDTRELIVELQIREVDVAQIGPGMKTEIEVDAFPGRIYTGVVESVASLAKEDEEKSHLRSFHTRVRLTGDTDKIHVGMSVTAKIIYRELSDVVAIPFSAVFYKDAQGMVRKLSAGAVEDIPIVLGDRGQLWVEVGAGLHVGDQIYSVGR